MPLELKGVPRRDRGTAYKIQWYETATMAWKDIQQRYPTKDEAEQEARVYGKKRKVRVRLMEIDNNKGKRAPLPEISL